MQHATRIKVAEDTAVTHIIFFGLTLASYVHLRDSTSDVKNSPLCFYLAPHMPGIPTFIRIGLSSHFLKSHFLKHLLTTSATPPWGSCPPSPLRFQRWSRGLVEGPKGQALLHLWPQPLPCPLSV